MAEMRSSRTAGPNSWNVAVELEREYMAAKDHERKAEVAYMVKLDGKRGWFRSLLTGVSA
jgi:hypothetical protein